MAIVDVSRKECTCDLCGSQQIISQGMLRPVGWESIKLNGMNYDLCGPCVLVVENTLVSLKFARRAEECQ